MTPSEETILFQSHEHITEKLDSLIAKIDKLNAQVEVLPELLRKILDLYLVADAEQPAPAPAVPAEPSEEEKARDAIVAARVADWSPWVEDEDLTKLSWNMLAALIAYFLVCPNSPLTRGREATLSHYPEAFVKSAASRSELIVKNIKTVSSEEIARYLESQSK